MSTADDLNAWLITEGRMLGDPVAIVESYATRLVEAGVPLSRANIAQRFANPLLVAWGVIWTSDETSQYEVTHEMLETSAFLGSPFDYVLSHAKPLHKSLIGLDRETEHEVYLELADAGGRDLFAMYLQYGDGSRHGCTFVSNDPAGFSESDIDLIQKTSIGLTCAIEPFAARKSMRSLLQTYLGRGPSKAVCEGTIKRGERTSLRAVVMMTDLRGFTEKSENWDEATLLQALDGYFDVVVCAVEKHGGDVLKIMGDGILSIFPIDGSEAQDSPCNDAIKSAALALEGLTRLNRERTSTGRAPLSIGVGIDAGQVTFGNIGSPARLDFTVLGPAVNTASRVQDLCKSLGHSILVTDRVTRCAQGPFRDVGQHAIRGVSQPIQLFAVQT